MQAKSRQHNYSSFIWPIQFRNTGKEGEKVQKIENLENEKNFLDKIKQQFSYNFWNAFSL